MQFGIKAEHWSGPNGKPAGGCTYGTGFAISWQNGPLGKGAGRQEPNGAFVENIIHAAIDRLNYYQRSALACPENARALGYLTEAMQALANRTKDRKRRGVEGTHEL